MRERLNKRLENVGVLLGALGKAAGTEGAIIDHHDGALRVYPIGNYTAEQLVHLITGEVVLASADSLILREEEFRSLAAEIKALTDEVEAIPKAATSESSSTWQNSAQDSSVST